MVITIQDKDLKDSKEKNAKQNQHRMWYIKNLLPKVFQSKGDVVNFDPIKIEESIIKETNMDIEEAKIITEKVVRRIISSNIKFLSGPHIRELVCSVLSEQGFENERKLYTRIGMPLMDYERLLYKGTKENANQFSNPESIHNWSADSLAEEYALLRLLTTEQSHAHLSGDIHVHMLRYFDLRPFCQEWDLRLILKYGLPPTKTWSHSACSGPAKSAMVAMLHAAKWLGIVQGEFSGGQGYDNFTTMISPYISGLNEKDIKQAAQCFIFETNQIFAARGGQVPFTSISCTPTVPKILEEIDAIGKGGKVVGKYGDFKDETLKLFNALTEIYYEGDGFGKLFAFPKHEIKLKKEWMIKYEDAYLKLMEETAKFGTPYFLNTCTDWLPDEVHSQCCRIILTPDGMRKTCDDPDAFDWTKSYMNMGSLQSISVNLPRVAYQANGDDDKLFEILGDRLNMMKDINLIKLNILKQRLKDGQLPLCASVVDGNQLLDMRKQSLSIGFTGLNEMVQYHTGQELHESDNAYNFGKKVLQFLSDRTEEFKYHPHNTQKIKFSLWEESAESSSERFARLDLKHYENKVIYRGTKDSPYYTNSGHLNYDADIPLFERILKQAEFHPIIKGGVITHLWMGEQKPDPEGLWQMTKKIAFNTNTAYFAYTFDFSYCTKCGLFIQGVHDECSNPRCDGKGRDIEIYSRVTGYYSRVDRWNKGKAQEFKDRKRYGFI